jgi:hypothetical protein
VCKRGLLTHSVDEAVIDLVRYEPDVVAPARGNEFGQAFRLQHRPGGIGRAGDDKPGDGALARGGIDLGRRRHPTRSGVRDQRHRLLPECGKDMAVAGISWRRQGDFCSHIEQAQECQHEPGRGAGGNGHPFRFHGHAVVVGIVTGDALAQRRHAERERVTEGLATERLGHAGERRARRGRARLAHLHVNDLAPGRFALGGGLHHIHDNKRGDLATARSAQRGQPQTGTG